MSKKKILIIEDESEMAEMVKMRLEANGYEILIAGDGQEGLDMARKTEPDLIILDIMLPKLDGYKVCRMLKFDRRYKTIPIVMFTARVQDSDKKIGEEVGADAYLPKPFEPEALLGKIRELLSNRTGIRSEG